jgi:hypothetical protein
VALAIDASTPGFVTGVSNPATTASFSPPANSMLVAFVIADESNTFSVAGGGLSWTQVDSSSPSGFNSAAVWVAFTTSAPGSITVASTKTGSFTANALKVVVFSGAETSFSGVHTNATNVATVSLTASVTGSWLWAAFGNQGGGTTDTAATNCTYNDAETGFGGVSGGVIRRTSADGSSGVAAPIGISTHNFSETLVALEIKPAAGAAALAIGRRSPSRYPGRGPRRASRFTKAPLDSSTAQAAAPTVLTDTAGGILLGGPADSLVANVVLSDVAGSSRANVLADTLAVGVVITDASAGAIRLGAPAGESVVNTTLLTDVASSTRGNSPTETLAIGVALPDVASGIRLGTTSTTLATGIQLGDTAVSATRSGANAEVLAVGIILSDPSVGALRAGMPGGENAVNTLLIADPGVGSIRLGSPTTITVIDVVLRDAAGGARAARTVETLTTGIVLTDTASAVRLGNVFGEIAAPVTTLVDGSVGQLRASKTFGEIVTPGTGLTDPSVGSLRMAGAREAFTTGVVLLDSIRTACRLAGPQDATNAPPSSGWPPAISVGEQVAVLQAVRGKSTTAITAAPGVPGRNTSTKGRSVPSVSTTRGQQEHPIADI